MKLTFLGPDSQGLEVALEQNEDPAPPAGLSRSFHIQFKYFSIIARYSTPLYRAMGPKTIREELGWQISGRLDFLLARSCYQQCRVLMPDQKMAKGGTTITTEAKFATSC
jgi:hypothetical protein